MATQLYTIGYEGSAQADLLHTLLYNDIHVLLDIRELPQSRKPGFSKTALSAALAGHGIEYVHIRALGTPRDIRHRWRSDHDKDAFREAFLEYLDTQDEAMEDLVERIQGQQQQQRRCCLFCYEANPAECHRWFVAERAKEMADGGGGGNAELQIVHLSTVTAAEQP